MGSKQKLKLIEELNRCIERMSSVEATTLGLPDEVGDLRIVIKLDMDQIEYNRKGCLDYVYMPKESVEFNMRMVTNPLRRICRKSDVNFLIETPSRCYKSRKSTIKEFVGYDSPEVTLDIV